MNNPTAAARVRSQVRSCRICGGKCGTGAGFLRVLRFPLPILIPPTTPHSSSGAGTIGQILADVPSGLSLTPLQETKLKLSMNNGKPIRAGNSRGGKALLTSNLGTRWTCLISLLPVKKPSAKSKCRFIPMPNNQAMWAYKGNEDKAPHLLNAS
jgi:hypothetical protein